ncbi:hypothetical protein I548_0020 [Mycobacterium intracellulare]|nr:hypothetical protein I548_0020 [Mycobacterium intracellulare]
MKPSDVLEQLAADPAAGRGYGEPYQTPDGTTVIVVAKPLGVFAVRNGRATWTAGRGRESHRPDRGGHRPAGRGDRQPGGAAAAAVAADHDQGL